MKVCTKCGENKEFHQFGKAKFGKYGLKSLCRSCKAVEDLEYASNHRKELSEYGKIYRQRDRERISSQRAIHTAQNKDRLKAYEKAWRLANPGKVNAKTARRRAAKLKSTPKWLTKDHWKQIQVFYILASNLTKNTGIPHEVDHICPLQGDNCSGLHVPWNLRVVERTVNRQKSNKLI